MLDRRYSGLLVGEMPLILRSHGLVVISLVLLFADAATLLAAPAKRAIAVMDFQNTSGQRSLDYLRTALPESLSGSLASSREIRVVERNSLGKVLKEIELEQSGAVDAGGVSRAGRLARADILFLGSFSGNPEKITVSMKAVDVATAVVLDARAVSAPLADILEQSGQAALSMVSAIQGNKTGFLTLTSNPEDVEVRIDGVNVGKTPLVEYKLSAGKHSVFLKKSGYRDEEREVTIQAGAVEKIDEALLPARKALNIFIGAGYQRLLPPSGPLKQGNLFSAQIGFAFGRWAFDLTYAFSPSWDHAYTYSTPFGALTDSRSYFFNAYLLGMTFEIFEFRYFSPYVGIFGGFTQTTDYELSGSDKTSTKIATAELFQLGTKLGLEILPRQTVSLFIEGRYQFFPSSVSRTTKESQGVLGGPTQVNGTTNLSSLSVGGGIRLHF